MAVVRVSILFLRLPYGSLCVFAALGIGTVILVNYYWIVAGADADTHVQLGRMLAKSFAHLPAKTRCTLSCAPTSSRYVILGK